MIPAVSKQMQFEGGELGVQLQEELRSSFPVTEVGWEHLDFNEVPERA